MCHVCVTANPHLRQRSTYRWQPVHTSEHQSATPVAPKCHWHEAAAGLKLHEAQRDTRLPKYLFLFTKAICVTEKKYFFTFKDNAWRKVGGAKINITTWIYIMQDMNAWKISWFSVKSCIKGMSICSVCRCTVMFTPSSHHNVCCDLSHTPNTHMLAHTHVRLCAHLRNWRPASLAHVTDVVICAFGHVTALWMFEDFWQWNLKSLLTSCWTSAGPEMSV